MTPSMQVSASIINILILFYFYLDDRSAAILVEDRNDERAAFSFAGLGNNASGTICLWNPSIADKKIISKISPTDPASA